MSTKALLSTEWSQCSPVWKTGTMIDGAILSAVAMIVSM